MLAINPENVEMSRFYASTMKSTAQKLVFKLYVLAEKLKLLNKSLESYKENF